MFQCMLQRSESRRSGDALFGKREEHGNVRSPHAWSYGQSLVLQVITNESQGLITVCVEWMHGWLNDWASEWLTLCTLNIDLLTGTPNIDESINQSINGSMDQWIDECVHVECSRRTGPHRSLCRWTRDLQGSCAAQSLHLGQDPENFLQAKRLHHPNSTGPRWGLFFVCPVQYLAWDRI